MRMAKSSLLTRLVKSPLESLVNLYLPSLRMEHLSSALSSCKSLVTLSLRSNCIRSLSNGELSSCENLYSLDLSDNLLESLDGICEYHCLGDLDISGNRLTFEELDKIRGIHVVCLTLKNNRGMKGSKEGTKEYRREVLRRCPNVWVLDDIFVSEDERPPSSPQDDLPNPPSATSPAGHLYRTVIQPAPTRNPSALSRYRLRHLLLHCDGTAHRRASLIRSQVHRPLPPTIPSTRRELMDVMGHRVRVDLAILLGCRVEFTIPDIIFEESLTVLLGGVAGWNSTAITDLVRLKAYALTAIVYWLIERAKKEMEEGWEICNTIATTTTAAVAAAASNAGVRGNDNANTTSINKRIQVRYNDTERDLVNAFPDFVAPLSLSALTNDDQENSSQPEDISSLSQRYNFASSDSLSLRSRHAVILLSRSPSCPLLMVDRQATENLQKSYEIMKPLVDKAGFSAEDLSVDGKDGGKAGGRFVMPERKNPNRPYERPWDVREQFHITSDDDEVVHEGVVTGTNPNNDEYTPKSSKRRLRQNSNASHSQDGTGTGGGIRAMTPHTPVSPSVMSQEALFFLNEYAQGEGLSSDGMEDDQDEGEDGIVHDRKGYKTCVRVPKVGDSVQVKAGVFSDIQGCRYPDGNHHSNPGQGRFGGLGVSNEVTHVCLRSFFGCSDAPFFDNLWVDREELVWDPRGFWSHVNSLRELQRKHEDSGKKKKLFRAKGDSGDAVVGGGYKGGDMSVPNDVVERDLVDAVRERTEGVNKHGIFPTNSWGGVTEVTGLPSYSNNPKINNPAGKSIGANPLCLFSADWSNEHAFVLASPSLVGAQNIIQEDRGNSGRWNALEDAPFVVKEEQSHNWEFEDIVRGVEIMEGADKGYEVGESQQQQQMEHVNAPGTGAPGAPVHGLFGSKSTPTLQDSSYRSSVVRGKFGRDKEELYSDFDQVMKEMGTMSRGNGIMNPDFLKGVENGGRDGIPRINGLKSQQRLVGGRIETGTTEIDIDGLKRHVEMRKLQMMKRGVRGVQGDAVEYVDSVDADDMKGEEEGEGEKIFGLTGVEEPQEENDENKDENKDDNDNSSSMGGTASLSLDMTALANDALYKSVALKSLSSTLTREINHCALQSMLPRRRRKVGPRPFYISTNKSKTPMIVTKSNLMGLKKTAYMRNLESNNGLTEGSSSPGAVPGVSGKMPAPGGELTQRVTASRGRLLLNDGYDLQDGRGGDGNGTGGYDDFYAVGRDERERARNYSAKANKWEQRFGVRSEVEHHNVRNLERTAAEEAKAYDRSHPRPIIDIDSLEFQVNTEMTMAGTERETHAFNNPGTPQGIGRELERKGQPQHQHQQRQGSANGRVQTPKTRLLEKLEGRKPRKSRKSKGGFDGW